jgi:hypothetical protein
MSRSNYNWIRAYKATLTPASLRGNNGNAKFEVVGRTGGDAPYLRIEDGNGNFVAAIDGSGLRSLSQRLQTLYGKKVKK